MRGEKGRKLNRAVEAGLVVFVTHLEAERDRVGIPVDGDEAEVERCDERVHPVPMWFLARGHMVGESAGGKFVKRIRDFLIEAR